MSVFRVLNRNFHQHFARELSPLSSLLHHRHHADRWLKAVLNETVPATPAVVVDPITRHDHHRHREHLRQHSGRRWFQPLSLDASPLNMSIDVATTPAAYYVEATIPGVKRSDIAVAVDKHRRLTIKARRHTQTDAAPETAKAAANDTTAAAAAPADASAFAAQSSATPASESTSSAAAQPTYTYRESYSGSVERVVHLPEDANVDSMTAKYEDGVLKIDIARTEVKDDTRTIAIN